MGSGAATGWPATDWVEDLLLRTQTPDVYDGWVTNEIAFDDPRIVALLNIAAGQAFTVHFLEISAAQRTSVLENGVLGDAPHMTHVCSATAAKNVYICEAPAQICKLFAQLDWVAVI